MTRPSLTVIVQGEAIEVPTEPRCLTCRSTDRGAAERLLVAGVGPAEVARRLANSGLTADSLREHQRRGHLAVELPAIKRAAAEAVDTAQDRTAQAVEAVADTLRLHRLVAAKAAERLASGAAEPTVSDGLAAERLVHEVEARAGSNIEHETWVTAMLKLLELVQQSVDHTTWLAIGERVKADPFLSGALAGQAS